MAHIHKPLMSKQSSVSKALFPFCKVWYNKPEKMCEESDETTFFKTGMKVY
jgi:hypothetical protein